MSTEQSTKVTVTPDKANEFTIELAPEVIAAGAEILSTWCNYERDFVSDAKVVGEMLEAMGKLTEKRRQSPEASA